MLSLFKPSLNHNFINKDAEEYIAEGVRKENLCIPLFQSSANLVTRMARLYDIRNTLGKKLEIQGYTKKQADSHPLYKAVTKLLQEYSEADHLANI